MVSWSGAVVAGPSWDTTTASIYSKLYGVEDKEFSHALIRTRFWGGWSGSSSVILVGYKRDG